MFLSTKPDNNPIWDSKKYRAATWLTEWIVILFAIGYLVQVVIKVSKGIDVAMMLSEQSFVTIMLGIWGGYFIANVGQHYIEKNSESANTNTEINNSVVANKTTTDTIEGGAA